MSLVRLKWTLPKLSARFRQTLGRTMYGLAWCSAGLLLVWAWYLKHPLLFRLRGIETPLLLGFSMMGIWVVGQLYRRSRRNGPQYDHPRHVRLMLWLLLMLAIGITTLAREYFFAQQKQSVLAATPDMRYMGQHFMVGFTNWDQLEILATRGLIGGVYLSRRNVSGLTPLTVAQRLARLQDQRCTAGLLPLLVATDQEGGDVAHLAEVMPSESAHMPPLSSLVHLGADAAIRTSHEYGVRQGQGLAALGVNLNLAPVVDLMPVHRVTGDVHTQIEKRAIASDPQTVRNIASAYSLGLRSTGVQPTLKHFPGLGKVRADTHLFSARLDLSASELEQDWLPFHDVSRDTGAAIMLSHVLLSQIDPDRPVSASRRVAQGILRESWHYEGLLLTDDMNMGAAYSRGIARMAAQALDAGIDLVLVTYDPDQYYRALAGVVETLHSGQIDPIMLERSATRMRTWWQSRATIGCEDSEREPNLESASRLFPTTLPGFEFLQVTHRR